MKIDVFSKYFLFSILQFSSTNHILVGITWEDAPISQYASIGEDYKVRCVVRANPPANIDWLKESLIISTGEFFPRLSLTLQLCKNTVLKTYILFFGSKKQSNNESNSFRNGYHSSISFLERL